jgi:hypothetical protein
MSRDRDREIQDLFDAARARPGASGSESLDAASADDAAELAAYALVFDALAEEPGDYLPADFADRVAERALAPRLGFAWFENVFVPLAVALVGLVAVPFAVTSLAESLASLRPLLDGVPLPLIAAAGTALVLAAFADRLGLAKPPEAGMR